MKEELISYPCPSCGAFLKYSPSLGKLECDFCKSQKAIETLYAQKNDYQKHLHSAINTTPKDLSCKKCGAAFTQEPYRLASLCPYCKTPTLTSPKNGLAIDGVIPFMITHKEAQKLFKEWVGSLWFAPTAFTKYLDGDNKLNAEYIPHWNFDTETITQYSGARGDAYYVTVNKIVQDAQGNRRNVQVQERRIRWTPVSGVVYGSFDDITTPASKYIDKAIIDQLETWNHSQLKGFHTAFLSGFNAQEYSTSIKEGFSDIKQKIEPHIRQKIRFDIGGDEQRIHTTQTQYNNTKYQNNLYPVWRASFIWNKKEYDYAVNAQSGKVSGERPYSVVKITAAVLGTIAVIAALYYISQIPAVQEYLAQFQ